LEGAWISAASPQVPWRFVTEQTHGGQTKNASLVVRSDHFWRDRSVNLWSSPPSLRQISVTDNASFGLGFNFDRRADGARRGYRCVSDPRDNEA
jgi:hypothetical protein